MTHEFDKDYWDSHWLNIDGNESAIAPNPYLARELSDTTRGTALEAGCGEGAEAAWLAAAGWQVTAVDISADVIARASDRAAKAGEPVRITWVVADLSIWEPDTRFDLVTTHYAHPSIPQLDFYRRISEWVAPGGTLLIVGHAHGHGHHRHGHGEQPPEEAIVTAEGITERFDSAAWQIETAEETSRTADSRGGHELHLNDIVVRVTRTC